MQETIEHDLADLRQSLEKAKALLAWKQLKDSENHGVPPSFQIYDPVEKDLDLEVNYFVSRALELHRLIDARKDEWALLARNKLLCMEREMASVRPLT